MCIRDRAVSEDICCYCGSDVDGALIYLETFAPDEQKARFEVRIQSLFESRWMMEMMEGAMSRVYELSLIHIYKNPWNYSNMDLMTMYRGAPLYIVIKSIFE